MKELKFSTKEGKNVYRMGLACNYRNVCYLYKKPSSAKIRAYERCYYEYVNDENSYNFGVGNANTFGFTCSWLTVINGEKVMIVKTKSNDYAVFS